MDDRRFDQLARGWAAATSRRTLLRSLAAGALGAAATLHPGRALARRCRSVGKACRSNEDCCTHICDTTDNRYRCSCPSGYADCDGDPTNGCETFLYYDYNNCGACGNACLPGATCGGGTCYCGGAICGQVCVDTYNDPSNCGACGTVCGADEVCCYGVCANTQTDPSHCGTCYSSCIEGGICQDGGCACPDGTTTCADGCVDTTSDSANCGGCGIACASGGLCINESCACPESSVACDGACVEGFCDCPGGAEVCSDGYCPGPYRRNHCGSCDNPCPDGENCVCGSCQFFCTGNNRCFIGADQCCDGEECVAVGLFEGGHGVCRCLCPEGLSHCFTDACLDLTSDLANCGSCGNDCRDGECIAGQCVYATPSASG